MFTFSKRKVLYLCSSRFTSLPDSVSRKSCCCCSSSCPITAPLPPTSGSGTPPPSDPPTWSAPGSAPGSAECPWWTPTSGSPLGLWERDSRSNGLITNTSVLKKEKEIKYECTYCVFWPDEGDCKISLCLRRRNDIICWVLWADAKLSLEGERVVAAQRGSTEEHDGFEFM